MLDYYFKVCPQLNEPHTRTRLACPMPDTGYSSVGGAPHRLKAVRPPTRSYAGFLFISVTSNFLN